MGKKLCYWECRIWGLSWVCWVSYRIYQTESLASFEERRFEISDVGPSKRSELLEIHNNSRRTFESAEETTYHKILKWEVSFTNWLRIAEFSKQCVNENLHVNIWNVRVDSLPFSTSPFTLIPFSGKESNSKQIGLRMKMSHPRKKSVI